MIAFLAAGVYATWDLDINFATIADSIDNAVAFVQRMFPLDFPPLGETVGLILETLAIVILATVLSVTLSIPVALAAAQATNKNKPLRGTARALIVFTRALPDLVLAIVFLRMFGIGAAAGILAMGIHSVGMVGKLYADSIEDLADGPREAIESMGGSKGQQITAGITQVLLPQMIVTALHRFDINLRTSVLLGYVGVGGIGLAIAESLRVLNYQRGMALALIVLVLCIATELLSGAIRAKLLPHSQTPQKTTWAERVWRRRTQKEQPPTTATDRLSPLWDSACVGRFFGWGALLAVIAASILRVELTAGQLWEGVLRIPDTLALFFPPSDGGMVDSLVEDLLVTINIALAATFLGAVLAVPIGILAARNVMPNPRLHGFFRTIIVVTRGIPELILAIIFVVITGLGAVAGTLALALGAVGLLSKLLADSLEETDTKVQEAVRATGATEAQVFLAATTRQVAQAFIAHIMYLLDTNIRSATLLGVVGAGGIGFQLLNAARVNQFDVVTTIVLMLLAVVLVVEAIALWVRKAVR
ncbi:MAG TPA: phosphonate ABC transporter, permease protein PhnE [Candidatus Corynebacterium gallistercoris]|uniref:Phosphonate ABC transporter, permease protein PhnE n=1 Tax=Candidatus Corynebacterium gallistercoris TaxID=2838530 RepID=A0A9D1RWZ4_9CORY|nr:phosphonate ABC transporter, permease protein PhnE [Candidatus Corynebacterium gallistercoris]